MRYDIISTDLHHEGDRVDLKSASQSNSRLTHQKKQYRLFNNTLHPIIEIRDIK